MTGQRSITIPVTPPGTLGTYAGFYVTITPQYSAASVARLDGAVSMDGTTPLSGATAPVTYGPYDYADFPTGVTIMINEPTQHPLTYGWVVQSYNTSGAVNSIATSPSGTFTLNIPQVNRGSAIAYARNPSGITPAAATTSTGGYLGAGTGTSYTTLPVTFTAPPNDPTYAGTIFFVVDPTGNEYWESAPQATSPATLVFPTPTATGTYTVYAAGFDGTNVNPVIPGITPSFTVTLGSATGVVDPTMVITTKLAASLSVTSSLFGVAALGITNSLLGTGAVATLNIQALAITNPLLASLAVQAANLATLSVYTASIQSGAVTATQIAALAVGTAAIQSAAITSAQIGALAVGTAAIQTAAITTALIANLAVGTAQIQALAVTDAQIASCNVSKLAVGTCTVSGAMIFTASGASGGSISISSGSGIIVQNGAGTSYVQINGSGVTIVGGVLTSPAVNGGTITGATLTITSGGFTTTISNVAFIGANAGIRVDDASWTGFVGTSTMGISNDSTSSLASWFNAQLAGGHVLGSVSLAANSGTFTVFGTTITSAPGGAYGTGAISFPSGARFLVQCTVGGTTVYVPCL